MVLWKLIQLAYKISFHSSKVSMVLWKLFCWLIKSTNWYPLVLWLYCKLQITDNKSISGTHCELILNSSAAFAGGIVRAVHVAVGDQVDADRLLAVVTA
jgi:hypothetical protein